MPYRIQPPSEDEELLSSTPSRLEAVAIYLFLALAIVAGALAVIKIP